MTAEEFLKQDWCIPLLLQIDIDIFSSLYNDYEIESIGFFIQSAMRWSSTKEGVIYWRTIADKYEDEDATFSIPDLRKLVIQRYPELLI